MKVQEVLELYDTLEERGIPIWIDGGWCIDALVQRQTRDHSDLDIAVARTDAGNMRSHLEVDGFREKVQSDTTPWNYVLSDDANRVVDVHVFEFDRDGNNTYGVAYPKESLTGEGIIAGRKVRCIRADWMFKFKTAYEPTEKDLQDVQALHDTFGFDIPDSHRPA